MNQDNNQFLPINPRFEFVKFELTDQQNDAIWDEYDRLINICTGSYYIVDLSQLRQTTEENIRETYSKTEFANINDLISDIAIVTHNASLRFLRECGAIQFIISRILAELHLQFTTYNFTITDKIADKYHYYFKPNEFSAKISEILNIDEDYLIDLLEENVDEINRAKDYFEVIMENFCFPLLSKRFSEIIGINVAETEKIIRTSYKNQTRALVIEKFMLNGKPILPKELDEL